MDERFACQSPGWSQKPSITKCQFAKYPWFDNHTLIKVYSKSRSLLSLMYVLLLRLANKCDVWNMGLSGIPVLNTVIEQSPLHVSQFKQEGREYGWAAFLATVLAIWSYSAALFFPGYTWPRCNPNSDLAYGQSHICTSIIPSQIIRPYHNTIYLQNTRLDSRLYRYTRCYAWCIRPDMGSLGNIEYRRSQLSSPSSCCRRYIIVAQMQCMLCTSYIRPCL